MKELNTKTFNIESLNGVGINVIPDIDIIPDIESINTIKRLGRKISSLNKSPKYKLSIYNHIRRCYVVIGSYPSFAVISKQQSEHDITMIASILQNIYSGKKLQKLVLIQKI
jgi:hypothetical protein